MLVFDLDYERHEDAQMPDFASQYKRESTVKEKAEEWEKNGWKEDPVNWSLTVIRIANQEKPAEDIKLPASDNAIVEVVDAIVDPGEAVVTDDFTVKTCALASHLLDRIKALSEESKPSKEDERVLAELRDRLAKLYAFKLEYISRNFVYANNHNLKKTLKWDGLDGKVLRARLGIEESMTDLAVLAVIASRLGLK